jgi:hypothetical protein
MTHSLRKVPISTNMTMSISFHFFCCWWSCIRHWYILTSRVRSTSRWILRIPFAAGVSKTTHWTLSFRQMRAWLTLNLLILIVESMLLVSMNRLRQVLHLKMKIFISMSLAISWIHNVLLFIWWINQAILIPMQSTWRSLKRG